MKLLEIQSSVRQEGSISRRLSQTLISAIAQREPSLQVQTLDVGTQPPNHPTELWTTANYLDPNDRTPAMNAALAESENLIEQLRWADRILLGVPMYNFSVPSTLKAYLDNIVRINRTFTFDRATFAFEGLVTGKKALIITPSAGNFVMGTPLGGMNFCDSYLRSVLGFIGITNVAVVPVPSQFADDELRQREIATAEAKLMEWATNW
jgi:FMN-dependent NADH-azoreductase